MTVTTDREVFEDLRAGQDEVPHVAGGRGWRAGVKHDGTSQGNAVLTPGHNAGERQSC